MCVLEDGGRREGWEDCRKEGGPREQREGKTKGGAVGVRGTPARKKGLRELCEEG